MRSIIGFSAVHTYPLASTDFWTDHPWRLVGECIPDQNDHSRDEFVSDIPVKSVRAILYERNTLSGKGLAGERLPVPMETQDQEDEDSCLFDTSHLDTL